MYKIIKKAVIENVDNRIIDILWEISLDKKNSNIFICEKDNNVESRAKHISKFLHNSDEIKDEGIDINDLLMDLEDIIFENDDNISVVLLSDKLDFK